MTSTAPELDSPYVLLDDNTGLGGPSALYTSPVEILRADHPSEVPVAISRLEAASAEGLHAAGFFAYELGYVLEPRLARLLPPKRDVPLIWFGLFHPPQLMPSADVEAWLADRSAGAPAKLCDVTHSWDEAAYRERFGTAVGNILSGDIYQINLTFRARFGLDGSPVALYRELRQKQRVAYGGIIETGEHAILSASPELFIERYGSTITTRPMKGTSPRGAGSAADEDAKRVLATDPKQRAENLMIVDLMRNDLGRIAVTGSVEVTDLFTVETFRTLHQMTSGVKARLVEGVSLAGLLEAIFPPGSVTGAPKIRAMELIAELEDSPRGVYCGAIGRISPDGHSLFNVAIRTPVFRRDAAGWIGEMGIGSGVVADSDGGREYAECLLKMRFLTASVEKGADAAVAAGITSAAAVADGIAAPSRTAPPDGSHGAAVIAPVASPIPALSGGDFQIIETMLRSPECREPGSIVLAERHLERMQRSAAHFGFDFDRLRVMDAVARAIETAIAESKAAERGRYRVRALLFRDGGVTVTTTPLPLPTTPPAPMRYVVSPTRLDSRNPWLAHKTTERQLYDREWQHYHDTVGADEVIYLNERGELAEGSRTTIFIERGSVLLTPPLDAGALPGVLRAELLSTGRAVEARLTLADADHGRLFLGNSVRMLVPAEALGLRQAG